MKFYEYKTSYDRHKKMLGFPPTNSWKDFYAAYINQLLNHKTEKSVVNCIIAEQEWYFCGKPYYKVWPGMIDSFIATRLDIPTSCLRTPFKSFVIRLPEEPLLDFEDGGKHYWVRTIIVMMSDALINDFSVCDVPRLTMWIDVGETTENNNPILTYRSADLSIAGSIEESFNTLGVDPNMQGTDVPKSILDSCIRLVIATCFIATGSNKVLERDVLSKQLEAYLKCTEPARRKHIEDKAIKRGKFGWHIGRGCERNLKMADNQTYADAYRQAGGRGLLYQHLRKGHFHTVRYGPQHALTRVDWFDEVQVRKDLPPKPLD